MADPDFRLSTEAVNAPRFQLGQEDKSPEVKGEDGQPGRRRGPEQGRQETRVGVARIRSQERNTDGEPSPSGYGSREEASRGEGTRGHQNPGKRVTSEERVRIESGRTTRLPFGWVTPDQRYVTWSHQQRHSQRSLECGGPRHGSADEPWSQASAASETG